jgi:hypothetical protein
MEMGMPKSELELLREQNALLQHQNALQIKQNHVLEQRLPALQEMIDIQKALIAEYEKTHSHHFLTALRMVVENETKERQKAQDLVQQQNTAIENLRRKLEEQKENERRTKFEQKKGPR